MPSNYSHRYQKTLDLFCSIEYDAGWKQWCLHKVQSSKSKKPSSKTVYMSKHNQAILIVNGSEVLCLRTVFLDNDFASRAGVDFSWTEKEIKT